MVKAYFAHSMKDYGTSLEKQVRDWLEKEFTVLCPQRDMPHIANSEGMAPFLAAMKSCQVVIVLEHKSYVGKGVWNEVIVALANKMPVLVWRACELYEVEGIKVYDSGDWKFKYAALEVGDMV